MIDFLGTLVTVCALLLAAGATLIGLAHLFGSGR